MKGGGSAPGRGREAGVCSVPLEDIRAKEHSTVSEGGRGCDHCAGGGGFYSKYNGKPLQGAQLVGFVTGLNL